LYLDRRYLNLKNRKPDMVEILEEVSAFLKKPRKAIEQILFFKIVFEEKSRTQIYFLKNIRKKICSILFFT